MKKLLLIAALTTAFGNSTKAQDCIGYIPENAIVFCDTTNYINGDSGIYWLAKDSSWAGIIGNNNIIYANQYRHGASISGDNNIVYLMGISSMNIQGNNNVVYSKKASIRITGNSNVIYASNITLLSIFNGSNFNILNFDTITTNLYSDNGTNTVLNNNNPCSNLQISTIDAPPVPCSETTATIENVAEITVYPNPAIDNVTFSVQNASLIKVITLYDVIGKTVEVIANVGSDKVTIDTSRLGAGMYVYAIMLANGQTERGKLLVG